MTMLVTGATGTVGRWVVHHLLDAGLPVRALSRTPERADLPSEVEVVGGDLDDVTTLVPALDGVTAVHLIAFGSRGTLTNGPAIVAALQDAGVERCTVLVDWDDTSLQPALDEAGFPWTHVMPVEFMANKLTDWADAVRTEGVVREVSDEPSALIHESDIGAVAAAALVSGRHVGEHLLLTGPEALTPTEQVAALAEATGRPLHFERMTPEEAAVRWRAEGLDEEMVAFKLELAGYRATDDTGAVPLDTVERVTGRPALTFRQWAEEHADAFRP